MRGSESVVRSRVAVRVSLTGRQMSAIAVVGRLGARSKYQVGACGGGYLYGSRNVRVAVAHACERAFACACVRAHRACLCMCVRMCVRACVLERPSGGTAVRPHVRSTCLHTCVRTLLCAYNGAYAQVCVQNEATSACLLVRGRSEGGREGGGKEGERVEGGGDEGRTGGETGLRKEGWSE